LGDDERRNVKEKKRKRIREGSDVKGNERCHERRNRCVITIY
jgi:hypothetical protein